MSIPESVNFKDSESENKATISFNFHHHRRSKTSEGPLGVCVYRFFVYCGRMLSSWSRNLLKSSIVGTSFRFKGTQAAQVINEAIRFPEVRVVIKDLESKKSTSLVLTRRQALDMARKENLDLILVNSVADPPVCKLDKIHKLLHKEKEKVKLQKAKQKARAMKEVLVKVGIDPHDLQVKMNQTRKFLKAGHPVKVCIFYHRKAMYKTQTHINKNSHLSVLPLVDIDEISAAVHHSLMDIPTTVSKKDVRGQEAAKPAVPTSTPSISDTESLADSDASSVSSDSEYDVDSLIGSDDYDDEVEEDMDDAESVLSADTMGTVESDGYVSDAGTVPSIVQNSRAEGPQINKFQMRREVIFFPKGAHEKK